MRRASSRYAALAVAAVALLFGLVGTSVAATGVVRATPSATWNPSTKVVQTGDRIVWVNGTDEPHTVTSISDNWSKDSFMVPGGSVTAFTFEAPGLYSYRCTIHSALIGDRCLGMCGRIGVNE